MVAPEVARFKSVSEYNSAMFKITSKLKLCGEKIIDNDMLEKTYSTFHASNLLLQQQYRGRGFKKYLESISCLQVTKQNNKLLMKNHVSRPTGSVPFPEVNAITFDNRGRDHNQSHSRGHGRGRRHSKGRSKFWQRGGYNNNSSTLLKTTSNEHKGKSPQNKNQQTYENLCFRCGMKGHLSRTRTSKHLVDLYQVSLKEKEKNIEANFAYQDDDLLNESLDFTNLDFADDPINGNKNFYW
ncbi:uncharacterized protein LOC133813935 [Humulus lupulus]|uniref:uncharacterized protein LOC133813935 n=1 Tax=Humulus lupulus TaxID=3486 RepID=UPI002B40A2E1|nr:uncharacterized protein LOC133813935 [Humulus lupulus]